MRGRVRLLRDVRESTMILLLYEVTSGRHSRLKGLAEKLDMTVAGASEYVKAMEKEGLVRRVAGEYRATKKGVEFLQEGLRALRTFVESSSRDVSIIDQTVALAAEDLREGDRVGLFMEKGSLTAKKKGSPSSGIATASARKGEAVWVRELEGIGALQPGKISIARVTARARADVARGLVRRRSGAVVAVLDVQAKAIAAKLAVTPGIEFAVVPASIEAAQRGRDVLLFCPEERVAEVVAAIESANARSEDKIPYETLSL